MKGEEKLSVNFIKVLIKGQRGDESIDRGSVQAEK